MPIFINKNNIYFLQNNKILMHVFIYVQTIFYISFKIILNKSFLVFKTQGLYIIMNQFSVNCYICKKQDIRMKVRMKS